MTKHAFLIIISIGFLILINLPAIALAEDNAETTDKVIEIEPVYVITATKTKKNVEGVAASVDVITSEEIKMMGAATLKDVIEKTPGLTMQYGRFPHPSSKSKSAISIRGLGANGSLLLLNGKRLASETERPYEMDRIPVGLIERIEIVKGPMSTLYGSDALGGVINIITKKPKEGIHGDIDLRGGMNDYSNGEAYTSGFSLIGKTNKLGYTLFANYNNVNPYTETESYNQKALNPKNNQPIPTDDQHGQTGVVDVTYRDDAEVLNVGTSLEYDFTDAFKAAIDFCYFEEDREGVYRGAFKKPRPGQMPPAAMIMNTPVKSVDDNKRYDYGADIKYLATDELMIKLRAYRSEYEKRNRTSALNFKAPVNKKFSADVDFTGYEAETIYSIHKDHVLVGGGEYREESRDSCAINPDPASTEFVNKTVRYKSLYLQDEWQISETLNAIFGARYDDISIADNKPTFKVGLVKNFAPLFRLRLNYAEGYRAPDAAEMYVVGPTPGDIPRIGAEAIYGPKQSAHKLDPEFVRSYEIGPSGSYSNFSYSIAAFYNDIEDKIELERVDINGDGVDDYQTYVNKSDVETMGVEVELGYVFDIGLSLNLNWTELHTEDKETDKDLLFNPERTVSMYGTYDFPYDFSGTLMIRYVGRQHKSDDEKADDYTITDIAVSKKFRNMQQYEIYGGINNMFDENVDKVLGSNVGRFYYVGARVSF
ncbi:MAG: TonB-dependent receptor [Deltaproteobacteria bacterium]|nr:TonB-dependent receptor [Deltaproteobacteria bacterium]